VRAAVPAWLLALLLAAAPLAAAAPPFQVHVSLDPAVVGLDETATLTIEAEGGGMQSLRFEPTFKLDNLEMLGGASQFEDINVINGNLSRSFRFSLRLRPLAVGPAHVRALTVNLRGDAVHLPDQELQVQEQPTGHAAPANGGGGGAGAGAPFPRSPADLFDQLFRGRSPLARQPPQVQSGPAAFLRAEVQPPRPMAGEQALYTVYLYTRHDVAAINATGLPNFSGFWVRDIPQPEHLTPQMLGIGNDRYARVALLSKALFALAPGHHVLEPAACDVVIESPVADLFGPMSRPEELHLKTPDLAVDVQPLPAAPPGFSGLVGQVSLAPKLQPYSLPAGEGAAYTLTLSGAGNLQGVPPPHLELPPGVTAFPPQQQSDEHLDGTTVQGRRTWTYVLVAAHPGRYAVRPTGILYFDPAHREYRMAAAAPVELTARGVAPPPRRPGAGNGTGQEAASSGTAGAGRLPTSDPRAPWWATWPRAMRAIQATWATPPLRVASVLVGLAAAWGLVLLALWARRRRLSSFAGNPGSSATAATAPDGTAAGGSPAPATASPAAMAASADLLARHLRDAAHEDHPRLAASMVEEGWRAYLAARWGLPPDLSPSRWGAWLAAHGAPVEIADATVRLVEELHYLRYAPQLSTTSAVRDELLAQSRQLLRRLRASNA
jgi:BatD DUF11 like domain